MLYILKETTFSGYNEIILDLFNIFAVLFCVLVVVSKNPIVSVLFLIGLFLTISCSLITTGLNFIGLSYLLVYIGAVSILFLFILMLINVRISELFIDTLNSIPLTVTFCVFFVCFVYYVVPVVMYIPFSFLLNNITLWNVTSSSWDSYLAENSHITSIGNVLYGNYSVWLIITSIILLLAMVGAIVITYQSNNKIEDWKD